jgi:hypothetical protein
MGRVRQRPYKTSFFMLFFRICTLFLNKKIKLPNYREFCINWSFKVTDTTTSSTDV